MAGDRLQLDILAKMAEDWSDTTQAMITIMIGLVMRSINVDTLDLSLDANTISDLTSNYTLDRTYTLVDGRQHMVVTLQRK